MCAALSASLSDAQTILSRPPPLRRFKSCTARGGACLLPHVLHSAWEYMERNGADAEGSSFAGEGALEGAARACAEYYVAFVLSHARAEQPPCMEYVALALAYGMPGRAHAEHARVRAHLPDLRTLKLYGFNVRKFTASQRYISRAVTSAVTPRAAP